ncbi:MAG: hypothetical protein VX278_16735 [Myxococcota bacterium]|nr:hypothetical protein [Myxococcota bacterium]
MLFIFLSTLLFASPLDEGDRFWGARQYHKAIPYWKEARRSESLAVSAMARYRLLLVSTNLMLPLDLLAADQTLAQCPVEDLRCALARVDRENIFEMLGFPNDLALATELLGYIKQRLPDDVQAREVWINPQKVDSLPEDSPVGLAQALRINRGILPRGPGGASLTAGFFFGERLGLGMNLTLLQPNIDHKMGDLRLLMSIGTKGYGILGLQYDRISPLWIQTRFDLRRVNYFQRSVDGWTILPVSTVEGSVTLGIRKPKFTLWIGPVLRWEELLEIPISAHGFSVGMQLGDDSLLFRQTVQSSLAAYFHLESHTLLQFKHPTGLALQVRAQVCPGTQAKWWRHPRAGGGLNLRLPPAQWIRGSHLYSGALEWHLFPKHLFGGVLFAEGAHNTKDHYIGAGVGVRMRLPPRPNNTLRLDVGYGSSGWGVSANVGEQF